MSTITIRNLTFAYPGQAPLFDRVSLTLDSSWRLGLLGRNGRGKTTLLKLLLGELSGQGDITFPLTPAFFPAPVADPTAFAGEAIGMGEALPQWQLERELAQLDCNPAILLQPFATLSGGEQTKLLLARAFADPRRFVLLDEPTNHLDAAGRAQLAAYLKRKRQGYIVTSHDRGLLDQVVDHVLVIESQQLTLMNGDFSTYHREKGRRDRAEIDRNRQLKQEISDLRQTAAQKRAWAGKAEAKKDHAAHGDRGFLGAKAAKMMKRSTVLTKRLAAQAEARQGLLANVEEVVPLTINYQAPVEETVLVARAFTAAPFPGGPQTPPLSLTLKRGQQVVLAGRNGSGKTTLLKQVAATIATHRATTSLRFSGHLTVAALPQVITMPHQSLAAYAKAKGVDQGDLFNLLHKLGIPRATFAQCADELSAGQQRKLALATCFLTPANLYLLDEPFNYLDAENQDQLVALIKQAQPTVLLVEHDQALIEQLGAPVVNLTD